MSPMSTFSRPVTGGFISNTFAQHNARRSVNPGTDYAVARGTVVVAPAAGVVKAARKTVAGSGAAGRFVVIFHDDGTSSDLLHLSAVEVEVGQRVNGGQRIALSGGSANGSETGVGAHVHWSLRTRQVVSLSNAGNIDPETRVGPASPWSNLKDVQARLNVWLAAWGMAPLVVDGVFGAKSRAALLEFQRRRGLTADGKIGPQSWAALSESPVAPVTPPPVTPPPVTPPPVTPPPVAPPLSDADVARVAALVVAELVRRLQP